jgi:hypothetical protein
MNSDSSIKSLILISIKSAEAISFNGGLLLPACKPGTGSGNAVKISRNQAA